MPLILTSCTNRKRLPPVHALTAHALRQGNLGDVAGQWIERLRGAEPSTTASDLYCGRAFRQAATAAISARATFLVVSAGLGLVSATTRIPSYSLTVSAGVKDNVLSLISGASSAEWWGELARRSPFRTELAEVARLADGPILLALSANYLEMIASELLGLPPCTRTRLRIFTLTPVSALSEGLRAYVLPYDARFDGPDSPMPGTRADFAQRALGHFVNTILSADSRSDLDGHAEAVEQMLARLRPQRVPVRTKLSDPDITKLIHSHWRDVRGQSGRMLRFLRDDLGIACEQGRLRDLFRAAKASRGGLS